MLYTRKGDDGKTSAYHCDQRFSKSSIIAEALGTLDEINSFLGVIKAKSDQESGQGNSSTLGGISLTALIQEVQENLFIIQAEVAGAPARMTDIRSGGDKKINSEKIIEMEKMIDDIEKELPPIKTFFISGTTELSALFDFSRTLARRAERRVVAVVDEGKMSISPETLTYLNRLSSLLYAFARQSAYKSGVKEDSPKYKMSSRRPSLKKVLKGMTKANFEPMLDWGPDVGKEIIE
jgi:cob(I)alamin adenosyltransferase